MADNDRLGRDNNDEYILIKTNGSSLSWKARKILLASGLFGPDYKVISPPGQAKRARNETKPEILEGIPYQLHEIKRRDQYLCNEHVDAFWPIFRNSVDEDKRHSLKKEESVNGFNYLVYCTHRNNQSELSWDDHTEYARIIGLKVKLPRDRVGFPDLLQPATYSSRYHRLAGVIEVGSFIDYMATAKEMPPDQRPAHLGAVPLRFLGALADHLELQVT